MSLPRLSGEFRLYGDPDLTFTPSGAANCKLRLVANDSKMNEATNKREDTETLWITAVLWRDVAENVANSLKDKDLVTVTNAKPHVRNYEDKEGNKKQSFELKFDFESSIGPSNRFRATPHSGQQAAQQAGQGYAQPQAQPAQGYAQPQPGYAQPQPGYAQPQPGYGQPQQQPGYAQPQVQPGYAPQPQAQPAQDWPPSGI